MTGSAGEMNRLLHQASPRRTRKESKLRSKVQSALPVSLPLDPFVNQGRRTENQ